MSETLIRCDSVGKKFCRRLRRSLWYGVQDSARALLGSRPQSETLRPDEFWANRGISFEVKRGECLGLIGRNGAGKTTLLKMLNGLIRPDTGRIEMRGRVGALIALGAGFNPLLTGRENIYVNGAVLGFSRSEIRRRLESIVEFAELAHAIDSPVQTYSSGMNIRLGFSIAAQLDADILLIDEVLAVGDAAFRSKCYKLITSKLDQFAVIFVAHSMAQIARICSHAAYLKDGELQLAGPDIAQVIEQYLAVQPDNDGQLVQLSSDFHVTGGQLLDEHGNVNATGRLQQGDNVTIRLKLSARRPFLRLVLNALIVNREEIVVAGVHSGELQIPDGESFVHLVIPENHLAPGTYGMTLGANELTKSQLPAIQLLRHDRFVRFQICVPDSAGYTSTALHHLPSHWDVVSVSDRQQ